MRVKRKNMLHAVIAIAVLVALVLPWAALADDISNTIDITVDSTFETMNLTQGGSNGTTNLSVNPENGDGKNGCNLTSSSTLVVSVNTSDSLVATVSPTSVTFNSCGDTPILTVTPHNPGSATITLAQTSNTTAGTFNLAPASFTVNVAAAPPSDTTPPVITPTITGTLGNNGWYTSDVTVTWTVTDNESGISSTTGCEPTLINTDTAGTTLTCSATSAGGTNSNSVTIKRDATGPTVVCTPPDQTIWYGANQTVSCMASDGVSGLADAAADASFSLSTSVTTGNETDSAATDSRVVSDNAGNTSTAGPFTFKVDRKAPDVVCDSADGVWHAGNVSIACTATDGGSLLANPSDANFSLTTIVADGDEDNNAATGTRTVTDNVGNSATAGPIGGNMIDRKAPVVTCDAPDGLWHATDAIIHCTATDGGSGLAQNSDASFSLTTNVANGDETADVSTNSYDVVDKVGNTSPAGPITGNMVDKKAPDITITAPTHTTYLLGQAVAANYGCDDGGSGSASCTGTVANGSNIDTASVGTKTFTVNAVDNVGNTSSSSVTYSVAYQSSGMCLGSPGHQILQPINADGTSVFKQGSTVPAKFRVCDVNGNSIGSAGVVSSFKLVSKASGTSTDTVNEDVVSTSAADSNFRWDPSAQQWIFNINTKNLTKGYTYTYQITLNDGSNILFTFGLK